MNALDQTFPNELVIVPAYGKRYKTNGQMLDAWKAGKDFQIRKGPYCSIRDMKELRKSSARILLTRDYFEYVVVWSA